MAEYLSPGVYVEEYDNSPRAIEGVGTSTAGFVGLAEKGPVIGAPSLVTSYADFVKQFGGPLSDFEYGKYRFLAPSVEQFFVHGGTRAFIVRVPLPESKCAMAEAGDIKIEAANPGRWANKAQIHLALSMKKKMQLLSVEDGIYTAKSTAGFREGDLVAIGDEYNKIVSILDNAVKFENEWKADVIDANMVPKVFIYLVETDITVRYLDQVEEYAGLNFNPISPNFVVTRTEKSDLVRISVKPNVEAANPLEAIFGAGKLAGTIQLAGGADGNVDAITAGTYLGEDNGPGQRTGLEALAESNAVNIVAVPGITIPEVVVGLVSQCERLKNRFAVLDMPLEMTKTNDLLEYRGMIDSTYAAMYHPWIQVFDRSMNKPGVIPPSGAVMGVYSRTDVQRGVHKAPANEVVSATGLSVNYTQGEQDILNPQGVNLIRFIPGQGIRVWGARTASNNAAFKYVNVRRLFIFVEESIKANTNWVVFEPNDSTLWSRVRLSIGAFLNSLWRNGMLLGDSPEQAFFVDIGTSTMTQDDIDNGRLICNVGIAPSKPAEFVIFRVTQHTSEAGGAEAE